MPAPYGPLYATVSRGMADICGTAASALSGSAGLSEALATGTATVSTACGRTRTVSASFSGWRVRGSIS